MNTEKHPFEPFLPDGARILFLGSFPPQEHRWSMPFYYPNWINDFWRIMGLIFFGERDHFCLPGKKAFNQATVRAFCEREGLAFYDTACEVRRLRDNASDAFLEVVTPTDVPALLRKIPSCRTLVTTGQKATEVVAQVFGCGIPPVGGCIGIPAPDEDARIRFWRMPSTSRAYPLPLEKKADAYRRLFPRKKLILWDLDGTLIDSLEDLSTAVNHALALRGLPAHPVPAYRKMVGHGVRNLVRQALIAAGRPLEEAVDDALKDFKAYYAAHIDVFTHPYPGIPELLRELQAEGILLAVTSNKFQEGTERLVRTLFPDIRFAAVLGDRPGFPLKPSPEIVEEVLARTGIAPEEALLVGDSPTDMKTAAAGGIDAVAVTWGYRTEEELAGNRLVRSVAELRSAVKD